MRKLSMAIATAVALGGAVPAHADPFGLFFADMARRELPKCANGVGVPGGCVGPEGEIVKFLRNGAKDITQGPGHSNDLFGSDGWAHRTFGNW